MLFLGSVIGMFAASYYGNPLLTNQDFIIWDKGFFRLLLSNLMIFVEGWCFIPWDILTPKDTQEDILTTNHLLNKQKESKGFGLKKTGEIKTQAQVVWGGKNLTISRNIPFIPQGRYVSFLDGDFGLVSIQSLQVRTWDWNRWISWTGEKSSTWKCSCNVYILLIICYITKCNVYS